MICCVAIFKVQRSLRAKLIFRISCPAQTEAAIAVLINVSWLSILKRNAVIMFLFSACKGKQNGRQGDGNEGKLKNCQMVKLRNGDKHGAKGREGCWVPRCAGFPLRSNWLLGAPLCGISASLQLVAGYKSIQ